MDVDTVGSVKAITAISMRALGWNYEITVTEPDTLAIVVRLERQELRSQLQLLAWLDEAGQPMWRWWHSDHRDETTFSGDIQVAANWVLAMVVLQMAARAYHAWLTGMPL